MSILKAVSILTKLLSKHNNAILDIKTPLNVNRALNQYGVILLDLPYHHSL